MRSSRAVSIAVAAVAMSCGDARSSDDLDPSGIAPPENVTVELTQSFGARISWEAVGATEASAKADHYLVYRTIDDDDFRELAQTDDLYFEDNSSVAALYPTRYYVAAVNDDHDLESGPSAIVGIDPGQGMDVLLDEEFRIDVLDIQATLDFYPDQRQLDGHAFLRFRMRDGQTKPAFHFAVHTSPVEGGAEEVFELLLDDDSLDLDLSSDVKIISSYGPDRLEIQRDIDDDDEHLLEVRYRCAGLQSFNDAPAVFSETSDLLGIGNDRFFPSVNAPGELATHTVILRLHTTDQTPDYTFVGSTHGEQTGPEAGVLQWVIESGRPTASSMMMFGLLPTEYLPDALIGFRFEEETRTIAGVPIRVVSRVNNFEPESAGNLSAAFAALEDFIPEFVDDFGPVPAGDVTILLDTDEPGMMWPARGAMEYHGAMAAHLPALKHEFFHLYFADSVSFRTYRDSWLDEAIDEWYTTGMSIQPVDPDYSSGIVSGIPLTRAAFDDHAYLEGAKIIAWIAKEIGGRTDMLEFLRWLHETHAREPLTTIDFIRLIHEETGVDVYDDMIRLVYDGVRDH